MTIKCGDCGGFLMFRQEGDVITVLHDCKLGKNAQEIYGELIRSIAASIREYPNGGGDEAIVMALDERFTSLAELLRELIQLVLHNNPMLLTHGHRNRLDAALNGVRNE